jgi:hypothetical protein
MDGETRSAQRTSGKLSAIPVSDRSDDVGFVDALDVFFVQEHLLVAQRFPMDLIQDLVDRARDQQLLDAGARRGRRLSLRAADEANADQSDDDGDVRPEPSNAWSRRGKLFHSRLVGVQGKLQRKEDNSTGRELSGEEASHLNRAAFGKNTK